MKAVMNPKWLLLLFLFGVLLFLMAQFPLGDDYVLFFRPAAESYFIERDSLLFDEQTRGLFNAPWLIFLLPPLLLLPFEYGQVYLSLVSLFSVVFAVHVMREKRLSLLALLLPVVNMFTVDLIIRGNVDGFNLIGLALGYIGYKRHRPWLLALGFFLLSTKPVNVLLPVIFIVWMIRDWSLRDKWIAVSPTILAILTSFLFFGPNWPFRYLEAYSIQPPPLVLQTSLWRAIGKPAAYSLFAILVAGFLLYLFVKKPKDHSLFHIALAAGLLFSPYAVGNHYVLLAPTLAYLVNRNKAYAWIWLFNLIPITRPFFGLQFVPLCILYPAALLIGLLVDRVYEAKHLELAVEPFL